MSALRGFWSFGCMPDGIATCVHGSPMSCRVLYFTQYLMSLVPCVYTLGAKSMMTVCLPVKFALLALKIYPCSRVWVTPMPLHDNSFCYPCLALSTKVLWMFQCTYFESCWKSSFLHTGKVCWYGQAWYEKEILTSICTFRKVLTKYQLTPEDHRNTNKISPIYE